MKTAVVIGHGASLDGRALGPRIDGADYVVRMHDCHWQRCGDHGSRYDFGVLPGPWIDRALTQIRRVPAKGWLCYRLPSQRIREHPPSVIMNRPVSEFSSTLDEITELLGRYAPTRGLMAVAMIAMKTAADEIVLAGFDSVRARRVIRYSKALRINPPAAEGLKRNSRHAYDLERDAIDVIADRSGCRVRFAEDVW